MATCETCFHAVQAGGRPDPAVDACAECGGPVCPHCCADPSREPYRHKASYCEESGEE